MLLHIRSTEYWHWTSIPCIYLFWQHLIPLNPMKWRSQAHHISVVTCTCTLLWCSFSFAILFFYFYCFINFMGNNTILHYGCYTKITCVYLKCSHFCSRAVQCIICLEDKVFFCQIHGSYLQLTFSHNAYRLISHHNH